MWHFLWEFFQTVLILGTLIYTFGTVGDHESDVFNIYSRFRKIEAKLWPEDDDEENQEDDVVQGETVGNSGTGEAGTVNGEQVVSSTGEQSPTGTV